MYSFPSATSGSFLQKPAFGVFCNMKGGIRRLEFIYSDSKISSTTPSERYLYARQTAGLLHWEPYSLKTRSHVLTAPLLSSSNMRDLPRHPQTKQIHSSLHRWRREAQQPADTVVDKHPSSATCHWQQGVGNHHHAHLGSLCPALQPQERASSRREQVVQNIPSTSHPRPRTNDTPTTPTTERLSAVAWTPSILNDFCLYQPLSFKSYSPFLPVFWDGGDGLSFETKCPFSVGIQQPLSFTLWRLDSNESDKLPEKHQGHSVVILFLTTGLHRS